MFATSYNQFMDRRRYTVVSVRANELIDTAAWRRQSYEIHLHPHKADRYVTFEWFGGWQYRQPFKTNVAMRVVVQVHATPEHRERGWSLSLWTAHHRNLPTTEDDLWDASYYPNLQLWFRRNLPHPDPPRADWAEFLELGRFVARTGETAPLLGWIEDKLPEPWSLLASPTPVEAFRALSPIPLFEGE